MDLLEIKNELLDLCRLIKENLIAELERQGHRATGKLIDSVDVALEQTVYSITIYGRYAYYGPYVDSGRTAGGLRVPVDALIAWIRAKRIDLGGRRERDVAFAIQTSIWKHGIPTNRDMGKRRFMSGTLEKMEQEIFERINAAFGRAVEKEIFNIAEATQTSINSIQFHS